MGASPAVQGGGAGAAPVAPTPADSGDQTPVPAPQGDGAGGGGDTQGGAASLTLPPAAYGQMLSAQESGAATLVSTALRATGAYAATTALTSPTLAEDMHMPGLPPTLASGRRLDLSV